MFIFMFEYGHMVVFSDDPIVHCDLIQIKYFINKLLRCFK